jgi:tryptophan synthase alpha chain
VERIAQAFARTRAEKRAAFVAYLCAGDPDLDTSIAVCRALIAAGIDVLELGVPFSDPLADGLTNQLAAQRALTSGMDAARVFELVRCVRSSAPALPIVFYTYYNLVFAHGVDNYARMARAAGVDGLLILDLPPEEAGDMLAACRAHNLKTVFIVAPTTSPERLPVICDAATGFIYYVSREGVTGVRDQLAGDIAGAVARIRAHTPLPVVVGFGISNRTQVAQVAQAADGVVVGSALVNVIRENLGNRPLLPERMRLAAAELVAGVRSGG